MVNYQLGKIYKIVCNTTGKVYVGSTCEKTLARRLSKHKSNFDTWVKDNTSPYMTSFLILELDNHEIILVESYPCNNKDELHSRERFHIENNECVNKFIPTRTRKEWRKENLEKIHSQKKIYYDKNKDKISDYLKAYNEKK